MTVEGEGVLKRELVRPRIWFVDRSAASQFRSESNRKRAGEKKDKAKQHQKKNIEHYLNTPQPYTKVTHSQTKQSRSIIMPKAPSSRHLKRQARLVAAASSSTNDPLGRLAGLPPLTSSSVVVNSDNDNNNNSDATKRTTKNGHGRDNDLQTQNGRGEEGAAAVRADGANAATETAVAAAEDGTSGGRGHQPGQHLSRGQKKRLAKREKYFKRERMILQSLKLARKEEQKGKIDGFDSLREALIETTPHRQQGRQDADPTLSSSAVVVAGKSNKAKRKLVADEVEHLELVLNHPQYNANPFETIGEHLQNSLADDRRRQELKSRQRSEDEQKLQKQKVEKKKELLSGYKKKSKTKKYKPRRTT